MASISEREKENALLLARLRDAVRLCRQRSCPQFVGFLDEHQQMLAQSLEKEMGSDSLCFYGGHSEAERTIAGFFPSYMGPDFTFFPIKSLSFSYRKDAVLQHRDFLGTMLSCGVRRDKIGDILCGTGFTVAFVNTEIADFLCDQIRKVGGEGVVVTDGFQGELPQAHHYKEIRDTVASPRLDAVVKAAIGASREEAARRITAGAVSLNHVLCENGSAAVREGDILSIRGKGRFRIQELGLPTRKGRLFLTIKKYI